MLNPFYIAENRAGEDQMTFAFACVLQQTGLSGLLDLLQTLDKRVSNWDTDGWDKAEKRLEVRVQARGPRSIPDAEFKLPDQFHLLFENKIRNKSYGIPLNREQIQNHLMAFTDSRYKMMLGITYFHQPPVWWKELQEQNPNIHFIYGSWQQVDHWAKKYIETEINPIAKYLLEQFRSKYLIQPPVPAPEWLKAFYQIIYDSGKNGITYSGLDSRLLQVARTDLRRALATLDSRLAEAGGLYTALLESRREQEEWVFSLHDAFLQEEKNFEDLRRMLA